MDSYRAKLVEQLVEHWQRMGSATRVQAPREWSNLELTMPQARILILLAQGPVRMTQIASHLGRGLSSATTMIDRLVAKGLVERAEDPADRRVVACGLTPAGEDAVEIFMRIGRLRIETIASSLTVKDLETVTRAIAIMADAASRAEPPGPSECRPPARVGT